MIADANVVLRALEPDPGAHGRAARARIAAAREGAEPLTVLAATVLEVAYALESAQGGYGWDRETVARAIEAVIDEPAFAVEHGLALRAATATYRAESIDLHDCYLDAVARASGTRVLSFDADLRRLGTGEPP